MKLKFKHQPFQQDAVDAVADLFVGQEKRHSTFAVAQYEELNFLQNDFGVGNALLIDDNTLQANMHEVQRRNSLPLTSDNWSGGYEFPMEFPFEIPARTVPQFCIEMETGTGKTYVYTKTIFELHKRYGFTKFIIVVPSVAIREGVHKSFQITGEHFAAQYDNVPCRHFIYNSAKLSDVRQFATSANIEIMIINIDAFKKAENIINQAQDKLNGETAMRYIQDTQPIVIIDEPQSVDNTPKAKEAIESLKPLCVLRYSATHREKVNLLYRLTPVDAHIKGLVKQICVSSNTVEGSFNKPYIKLLSVSQDGGFKAKIELDVAGKDGKASRKTITAKPRSDLFALSGARELYQDYVIEGIDCTPGFEGIEFTNGEALRLGKAIGDINQNLLKRAQIRRTIEAHFEKELRYFDRGIKVLSLFFIDEVAKYRTAQGEPGIYATMFEECYAELLALPKFAPLRDKFAHENVHDGYFSQDKRGGFKDTRGDTQADDDTYALIMKDKERLLSFECPLRFIFSHSALKEGWDNPNVFQVCTLIEQKSTFTARQKIGRGLRLCVNQNGERIEDKNINVLHVMANESFTEFAGNLQREIEQESGVKFGVLQLSLFSGLTFVEDEVEKTVSYDDAQELITHFEKRGYVSKSGKIKDTMKEALAAGTLDLPAKFEAARERFEQIIVRADTKIPVRDASRNVTVRLNKKVLLSPEFLELWDKIKQKTVYRVAIDTEKLVANCVRELKDMPPVQRTRIVSQTADINVQHAGVTHTERAMRTQDVQDDYSFLPNLLAIVGEQCLIRRAAVNRILQESGRAADFVRNPQLFMEAFIEIIKRHRHKLAIDGIRYVKLDGEEYYAQEIFGAEELIANLDHNAVPVDNSVYDHVLVDSDIESAFAQALNEDDDVKLFVKLPPSFMIDTPIGTYNPDWAVLFEKNGEQKLYFVIETKGTTSLFDLRGSERLKVHCGRRHFEALGNGVVFHGPVAKWREVKAVV